MAKSYAQREAESIAKYGKTLYQRRKESGQARGLTTSQARGHARAAKGEQRPSVIKAGMEAAKAQFKAKPAVKSSQVSKDLKSIPRVTYAGGEKIVTVRSEQSAYNAVREAAHLGKRVLITVYGKDGQPHTIYRSPTSVTRYGAGATASWVLDQMEASGNSLDEQLESDYASGSCGPLPEIGDIAVYQVQFVDAPARAA